MNLHIFIDSMHGSAANCISQIFDDHDSKILTEIRADHDPFFGGNPPEPLLKYLENFSEILKINSKKGI